MKNFIVILVVFALLGGAGYVGYTYLTSQQTAKKPTMTKAVTLTGVLQTGKGDDYDFVILTNGKITGVTTYKLKLDQYIGKRVTIEGQYSGTTMYADSITETK